LVWCPCIYLYLLQSIFYRYDAAGNLKEQTDGNGRKTVYTYDENNRLIQSDIFTAAADAAPTKTITYSYNEAGSLTGYDDATTSAVYSYDDLQRRIGETVDYGSFSLAHSYGYYKNSQKKTYTDPAGRIRTWTYDKANRPLGLDPGNGAQLSIGTYNWNRPGTITLPGGATLNYSYNGMQQVVSITPRDPGGNPVLDYNFSYSPAGNVASKSTEHGDYAYDYDKLYRLTSAQNPDESESYSYDGLGNRISSDKATLWVYNGNNQLNSFDTTTFGYDDQGNMTGKTVNGTTTTFNYSVDNRLEKVEDQGGTTTASYYYDPYGRRLWKEVAGARTYFHYNDEGLAGEYNGAGNELRTYGYQPGSPWSTNPLFIQAGGEYYWYQNDHLGTPQKMISANGTVVWSARYDSFGLATVGVETVKNNLRFPGQYFDYETGLHYNWHRFYDPETGRYITADPIGLDGGINLYAYVENDPINWVDPWGLLRDGPLYDKLKPKPRLKPRIKPSITPWTIFWTILLEAEEAGPGSDQIPLPGDESINPDGTVDDSAGVDNSCDKKGKWKCWGKAQYDQENTPKHVRRGSTMIIAYGHDRPSARNAWIKKSQNAAPRHFTARHIMPQCKKIR
jgi:RHS repeat-associated protein